MSSRMSSLKNCANALSPSLNPPAGAIYFLARRKSFAGIPMEPVRQSPLESGLELGLGEALATPPQMRSDCFSSAKMPPPEYASGEGHGGRRIVTEANLGGG